MRMKTKNISIKAFIEFYPVDKNDYVVLGEHIRDVFRSITTGIPYEKGLGLIDRMGGVWAVYLNPKNHTQTIQEILHILSQIHQKLPDIKFKFDDKTKLHIRESGKMKGLKEKLRKVDRILTPAITGEFLLPENKHKPSKFFRSYYYSLFSDGYVCEYDLPSYYAFSQIWTPIQKIIKEEYNDILETYEVFRIKIKETLSNALFFNNTLSFNEIVEGLKKGGLYDCIPETIR